MNNISNQTIRIFSLVAFAAGCSSGNLDGDATVAETNTEDVETSDIASIARSGEVAAWSLANHAKLGRRIAFTETLADGRIVDWVERSSVPGADVEPPPPLPAAARPAGIQSGTVEELHGPDGTVPYIRPAMVEYVQKGHSSGNLEGYLKAMEARQASRTRAFAAMNGASGNPTAGSGDRLYGGVSRTVTNHGVQAYVNNQWSNTDNPSSPDFSFLELASYCDTGGGVFELVGGIVGRDPQIYGNNIVFGVEYLWRNANGTQGNNWISGGGNDGAWVQTHASTAPGTTLSSVSTIGGANFEYWVSIQRHGTQWWVWLVDKWLGYVNATTAGFASLNSSACIAAYYGEAYDPDHETTPWMDADMGSGLLAAATFNSNYLNAGYVRLPNYYTSNAGGGTTALGASPTLWTQDASCYNRQYFNSVAGNPQWSPVLFFGGPGGDGAGCN
jgi:hypothetical protein